MSRADAMLSEPFELGLAHVAACQRLSVEAGWNQNEDDWRFILRHGFVLGITRGEELVATAGVVPYGERFGWICMVLVTATERRNGIAFRLMQACMAWLETRGAIAGLDATPQGRHVYSRLGFRDVYAVTRYQRSADAARPAAAEDGGSVRSISDDDLAGIAAFDRTAFGGDRLALLTEWRRRMPDAALCIGPPSQMRGYLLARNGRSATHIGPLVARDMTAAGALLRAGLDRLRSAVVIDVPDHHRGLIELLMAQGFSAQRTFVRMLLGRSEPLDCPGRIFALTGAEFG